MRRRAPALLALLACAAAARPPADSPASAAARFAAELSASEEERDPAVPAPESVIGHPLGARYTSPEEISAYVRALAAASPRVAVTRYGTTPEGRELLAVSLSTPENLARRAAVAEERRAAARGTGARQRYLDSAPTTVWISCSIHGDEPGGGEAAIALLFRLASSRAPEVADLLSRLVVVIDPAANPDGRARHVAWSRSVTGATPDPSPDGLENSPPWPPGRFNDAGFDLNRDWAWATQPETRGRIAEFLRMRPHVFVDVHEMSSESTYFFPPDAEPVHPNVPPRARRSLEAFGRALAAAFDARGWSYFVRESFDLFYPAYGDSWPTLHGAVGMTFETAGSEGLAYRRKDGTVLTLPERIVKHVAALSAMLRNAAARRREILSDALEAEAPREGAPLFAVPADQDPGRLRRLAALLTLQGVEVERTTAPLAVRGGSIPSGSLLVDAAQPSGAFAQTLLEPGAALPQPFVREERGRLLLEEPDRFYDVTAWSLPLAFGLRTVTLPERRAAAGRCAPWKEDPPAAAVEPAAYGWLLPGDDFESRGAAGRLLAQGVRVEIATRAAKAGSLSIAPGSFVVRRENNDAGSVEKAVLEAARAANARAVPLAGSWTDEGPSLGSHTVIGLKTPNVVLLTGDDVDSTSAGTLRLALERDLGTPARLVRASQIAQAELAQATVILVPNGGDALKRDLEREENAAALRRWVEGGGVLVGVRGGASILRGKALHLSEAKTWEPPDEKEKGEKSADEEKAAKTGGKEDAPPTRKPEAASAPSSGDPEDPDLVRDLDRRPLALPGAALRTRGLAGHPLLFGMPLEPAVLVLDGRPPRRLARARDNVLSVASSEPLAAGFGWKEALQRWQGAPVLQCESVGRGKVISFAIEPAFRGIWLGTETLLLNAVLLGPSL